MGFCESVFENHDMWPRGIEFSEASGLGKDVHGILQRYHSLKTWSGFTLGETRRLSYIFCREMETIRDELSFYPSGVCAMDWKVKYNTGT
ncbi:hypothetical protein TNCV_2803021 [Trichonephila clavipes]|nr:hypothetical protein TNCV_2803021 [Trichonephila clavipes]